MQLVEVDPVGVQATQRLAYGSPHLGGGAVVRADLARLLVECPTEFRRDNDAVSTPGERLGQNLLAAARAVDVGGVEEGHTEIQRSADRPNRFMVVDLTPAEGLVAGPEWTSDRPAADP